MIVITGGIGSGKSVVARILRLQGFGVFDCDYEARVLMESSGPLARQVRDIAGNDVYGPSGLLDRRKLADRIFGSPALRLEINQAVHSAVKIRMREWLKESERNVFVETAIAAGSGIAEEAQEIWLVEASSDTRMHRVRARDGRSKEDVESIMTAQEREEELLLSMGKKVVRISNNPGDPILETILKQLEIMTTQKSKIC